MDYKMKTPRKKETRKRNKQIRRWKMKKGEDRSQYQALFTSKLDEIGLDLDWNEIEEMLVSTAKEKLGQKRAGKEHITRKRVYGGTKTPDVLSLPMKRRSRHTRNTRAKSLCIQGSQQSRQKSSSNGQRKAYDELYTKLDTREGAKKIYKLAKSGGRRSINISDITRRWNHVDRIWKNQR